MRHSWRRPIALVVIVLLVAVVSGIVVLSTRGPSLTPAQVAEQQALARAHRLLVAEQTAANGAKRKVAVQLPTREGEPAPTPSGSLFVAPLPAHRVVGFVPYFELAGITASDLQSAGDVVYSQICPAADGGVSSSGNDCALGYQGLNSTAFAAMVQQAHAYGDKVLLSVETTNDALIERYDAHAATLAPKLAATLASLVRVHGLDGVNIDFEGTKPADRAGYVRFVDALAPALRADDAGGELLLDTYAGAAGTVHSFFDPAKLAPLVDALFVEAYSLESTVHASANAPLETSDLGYSAAQSLVQYLKVVPASKLILGVPFYGFQYATSNRHPGSDTVVAPAIRTYTDVLHAHHQAMWDPASETPVAVFQEADGSWHQLWVDNPVSIALKVALAAQLKIAGVGVWALGMEDGDTSMLAALDGGRAPVRALYTGD